MRKGKYTDQELKYLKKEFPEEYKKYLAELVIEREEKEKKNKIILITISILVAIMILTTIGFLFGVEWVGVICVAISLTVFFAFLH